ncbi:T9SS type B sorting domain-containing protein [Mesoflavibacter zeaxanthinifaciens]|uniref:T9SS type B sorting domain-containing protein n=1 Tax=Mesoflavibacter zeaxanthinifaciens TaxID=393060 RepID=UPI0026EF145E|nr:T9SS type B sorting domain-containing protein [Mesoflavibacter zeaxanthinifaciens]
MRNLFLTSLFLTSFMLLNAQNQTVTYNYCDDDLDGFMTFDISGIEEAILFEVSPTNGDDIERILISTATSSVLTVDTPSNNPTIQFDCQFLTPTLSDVALDVDKNIYLCSFSNVYSDDNSTTVNGYCTASGILSFEFGSIVNALSFDLNNNMYIGLDSESNVYRYDVNGTSPPYVWHEFDSGSSGGDFVILNDKMYISWRLGQNFKLYEVTYDSDFNYVSHVDLGLLLPKTYGLASELGKLYGVTEDELYQIDLDSFTFNTIVQNDGAHGDWYGASGYHEAVQYEVSSHISSADANSNSNPLPENWTNTISGGQTIYIRIENSITGEYIVVNIVLNVFLLPETTQPDDLVYCADQPYHLYDLTEVEDQLLQNVTQDVTVTYFDDLGSLEINYNPIYDIYQTFSQNETIYAKVKSLDSDCYSVEQFNVISNPKPILAPLSVAPELRFLDNCLETCEGEKYFNLNDAYQLVVLDDLPLVLEFYLNAEDAENEINQIPEIYQPTIGLQEEIFVKAYNEYGCYSITNFFIDGNCEVKDLNVDCFIFPKYFTPNGDGDNDYWNVYGLSENIQRQSMISIYDRFGKLLYTFKPSQNLGWDGTFNNNKLPSTDYWYIFTIDNRYKHAGHFSLLR